ncbi:MAG: Choline-sulfatase [Labilithrix sp.]|nr:Choline-sulfatase [Labilithrix sp.]
MLALVAAQIVVLVIAAAALVAARGFLLGSPPPLGARVRSVVVLAAAGYLLWIGWAVAKRPARYAEALYARGGAARTEQVLLTDVVGTRGVGMIAVGLAILYLGRGVGLRGLWRRRRAGPTGATLLVVAAAAGSAAMTACQHDRGLPRGNVVVVRAASFRADRLDARRAPHLAELAAHAQRFTRAYASLEAYDAPRGPLVGPPGYVARTLEASSPSPVSRVLLVLPIVGTALGRVAAPALHRAFVAGEPAAAAEDAIRALRDLGRPGASPFFLAVELGDVGHAGAAPYSGRFTDPAYRGPHKYLQAEADAVEEADRAQIRGLHDEMIAEVDDAAGAIVRELAERGLARDTTFVFTARRGAALFEDAAGEAATHVPLVVVPRADATAGGTAEEEVVRDVDVVAALDALRPDVAAPFARWPAHAIAYAVAPAMPGTLPAMVAQDASRAVIARPRRTHVEYTGAAAPSGEADPLAQELLAWRLADPGARRVGDFIVPRRRLPFEVRWTDARTLSEAELAARAKQGVRFTRAIDTGPDLARRRAALEAAIRVAEGEPAPGPPRPLLEIITAQATAGERVPLLLVAPDVLPRCIVIDTPVGLSDVLPTARELLELEPSSVDRSARSLAMLSFGFVRERSPPHPVLATAPGLEVLVLGPHRLVVRGGRATLFDDDAGPVHEVTSARPDLLAEMEARLAAARAGVPVAGSVEAREQAPTQVIHLRFAGAGARHAVSGAIHVGSASVPAVDVRVEASGLGPDAYRLTGDRLELSLFTDPGAAVGLDITLGPLDASVTWELHLDDAKERWAEVFAGPYGVRQPVVAGGLDSDEGRFLARLFEGDHAPALDPRGDLGMLVTRTLAR